MAFLNYKTLCRLYTLSQIEAKIIFYTEALEGATVESYDKDTTQGRQKVTSAPIEKIESLLAVWLKAKECITGAGTGGGQIVSGNFRTGNRGAIV